MSDSVRSVARPRVDSIDLLRGLVIVLMALDHARDFFGPTGFAPENLERGWPALFLTRWVTHFCAPVFLLLAGVGAYLYKSRGRSPGEVAWFLASRGLFLIVLELTVINLSWLSYFNGYMFIQVIWVIGWSMIALAGLLYLPNWAVIALGLVMVGGHNLLDGIQASGLGSWAPLWGVLHQRYWQPLGDSFGLIVIYPLIPWVGVMALGYAGGAVFTLAQERRRRILLCAGLALTAGFVALRALNVYGDPSPWEVQAWGGLFTILSFLNATKYPASLSFLLMTLGPSIALLSIFESLRGRLATIFVTFGRVPLFFYVLHIPVLHLAAAAYSEIRYDSAGWFLQGPAAAPESYEPRLLLVYVAWIGATAALYPTCRWFARVKRTSANPLLSYF